MMEDVVALRRGDNDLAFQLFPHSPLFTGIRGPIRPKTIELRLYIRPLRRRRRMSELKKRLEFAKQIALIAKKAKDGEEWALEEARIEIARLVETGEQGAKTADD